MGKSQKKRLNEMHNSFIKAFKVTISIKSTACEGVVNNQNSEQNETKKSQRKKSRVA